MKHILSRAHVRTLERLAGSRALLAFDFDGTLAPIVPDRDRAVMRSKTHALLAEASELYPSAVISGRARDDVASKLGAARVKYVVGNHGIEPGPDLSALQREIDLVRPLLARALAAHPGTEIEDKRYSLAVHYRAAPQKRVARAAIAQAISSLPRPMRVIPGKLVANVVPHGARDKGRTLLELLEREKADLALYVGDDVTDEDVFALPRREAVLAMRVGKTSETAAKFYLRDQREIDRLLAHVVKLRSGQSAAGRARAPRPAGTTKSP